jgi:hypothetical protein
MSTENENQQGENTFTTATWPGAARFLQLGEEEFFFHREGAYGKGTAAERQ